MTSFTDFFCFFSFALIIQSGAEKSQPSCNASAVSVPVCRIAPHSIAQHSMTPHSIASASYYALECNSRLHVHFLVELEIAPFSRRLCCFLKTLTYISAHIQHVQIFSRAVAYIFRYSICSIVGAAVMFVVVLFFLLLLVFVVNWPPFEVVSRFESNESGPSANARLCYQASWKRFAVKALWAVWGVVTM